MITPDFNNHITQSLALIAALPHFGFCAKVTWRTLPDGVSCLKDMTPQENQLSPVRAQNAHLPKKHWYSYFFGIRGLLRLYPIIGTVVYSGFFFCALLMHSAGASSHARLIQSARLALYFWGHVLVLAFIFTLMLWIRVIHAARGWAGAWAFSDECKEYDWWGRQVPQQSANRSATGD